MSVGSEECERGTCLLFFIDRAFSPGQTDGGIGLLVSVPGGEGCYQIIFGQERVSGGDAQLGMLGDLCPFCCGF